MQDSWTVHGRRSQWMAWVRYGKALDLLCHGRSLLMRQHLCVVSLSFSNTLPYADAILTAWSGGITTVDG